MSFLSLTTSEFLLLQQSAQQACWKGRHAVLPMEQLLLHSTHAMCVMPFSTVNHHAIMLSPSSEIRLNLTTMGKMVVTIDSLDII